MTARIGVHTRDPAFVAAVAELAPRVVPADDRAGAVCVVSGRGVWWEHAESAAAVDARAVVVVEPGPAPDDAFDRLATLEVPILVSRRRLRADVVSDAEPPATPRLLTADVFAPHAAARAVVRDALGWLRVLGGVTRVVTVAATPRARLVALRGETVEASLTLAIGGPGTAPAIDVLAVGPTRVEVRLDEAVGTSVLTRADASGVLAAPARFESAERLILRHAIEAPAGARVADLDHLRIDDRLAAAVMEAGRP